MTDHGGIKVALAMGKDAFDSYVRLEREAGRVGRVKDFKFKHWGFYTFDGSDITLLETYHFRRYNINTCVLTEEIIDALFVQLRGLLK